MNYLVGYDVSGDLARRRVAGILLGHGLRLQRSLFECDLRGDEIAELTAKVASVLRPNQDILQIFPHCERCVGGRVSIGRTPPDFHAPYWII